MTERPPGRALLGWYRKRRRDLPWRRTKDPYAIWVSEVMLQQTTVAAVSPRWKGFLRRFPTVEALARAPEPDVLAAWAGLGYYARARRLRKAARAVVSAGAFPRTADAWRVLPGVGPYTAAAVASICFGEPAAALDANASRVLARLGALRLDSRSPAAAQRLRSAAEALLDPSAPGESNQALMELGATVCKPRAPRCPACPLRASCEARRLGRPEEYPPRKKRRTPRPIHLVAGVAFRRGKLLLAEDHELVPGHLIVPLFHVPAGQPPAKVLRKEWENVTGRRACALEALGKLRHSVMDRRYHIDVFTLEEKTAPRLLLGRHDEHRRTESAPSRRPLRLLNENDLARHAHGGLVVKLLRLLESRHPGGGRARPRPRGREPWRR